MKGFFFEAAIGSVLLIIIFMLMVVVAPIYIDNVAPIMKELSNSTDVDNTIDLGVTALIGMFFVVMIGIVIWMLASTQKQEFDSAILEG